MNGPLLYLEHLHSAWHVAAQEILSQVEGLRWARQEEVGFAVSTGAPFKPQGTPQIFIFFPQKKLCK